LIWKQLRIKEDPVFYECIQCGGAIQEYEKRGMLMEGCWEATGSFDGCAGFHISELYSPWVSWSDMVVSFESAKQSKQSLKVFINTSLGETWEERGERSTVDEILRLKDNRPRGIVPSEALALTAGIDTQDNGFYYVIRAWGPELESWLVAEGFVVEFDHVTKVVCESKFSDIDGNEYVVYLGLQDSAGHRTSEVYEYCRRNRMIVPTKGEQRMSRPVSTTNLDYYPGTKRVIPGGLALLRVNTTYFKNKLSNILSINLEDPGAFHLHSEVQTEYARQMISEYRDDKGIWQCPRHKANHYWDCEVLALCAAEQIGVKHWGQQTIQETPTQSESNTVPTQTRRGSRW
jgi:phage terminase large subunit GpA-like protein